MGVCIMALSGMKKVDRKLLDTDRVYHLRNIKGLCQNMTKPGAYYCESTQHILSMPYSSYNEVRSKIAILAGLTCEKVWEEKNFRVPFYRFINFSDCEGSIDQKNCQKLLVDFNRFKSEVIKSPDEYFKNFYLKYLNGLEYAVNNNGALFYC